MKERPILFSGPMASATVTGTKTQTRRIIKPAPEMVTDKATKPWEGDPAALRRLLDQAGRKCPFGAPGDRLWGRETCRAEELPSGLDGVRYAADKAFVPIQPTPEAAERWIVMRHYRGHNGAPVPAIHMPRWASRLILEITDVRVERLQDISEADAIAEGILRNGLGWRGAENLPWFASPIGAYRSLWEQINGAGSWDANPWVWVVEYTRIQA